MASEEDGGQQAPLLTSSLRLQKIDRLRELNIGTYLPLPQLVAVGDQSSGKSSLLESLTGIPFPRGQELCTRYATQITHRRDQQQQIVINIIPGPHASRAHKEKLEAYSRQIQTTAQLGKEFLSILAEVNAAMGIRTSENPGGEHTFSEDILKIGKCGPNEDYLTIIDVPGIFRNVTEGITTNQDKELVKNMVHRYTKDSRTIILAVLPCNVDVATQEILSLAEEADPTGDRTLGILTKADLLKEQSAKLAITTLVEGNRKPLKLGYHVVTNRGGDDHGEEADAPAALRQREAMFLESPWFQLPEDRVGVAALRERLEDLLGQITDKAFPELRTESRQRLQVAEEKLKELGTSRQTEREQQQYLVGISSKFQALVRAALNADYSAHPVFSRYELRLITAVVSTTNQFNIDFATSARTYLFQSETAKSGSDGEEDSHEEESNNEESSDRGSDSDSSSEESSDGEQPCMDDDHLQLGEFDVPMPDAFPDLHRIIVTDWDTELPKKGIMEWIKVVHQSSRGLDLGPVGHGILSSVFREQSAKWETMAKQYLSKIILIVHRFILQALDAVCGDKHVLQDLTSAISDALGGRYKSAMAQAVLLVDIERQLEPYTLNRYFNHNQQKSNGKRLKQTLRPMAHFEDGRLFIDLDNVASAATNKSNTEHATETIHDTLEAYYKVAYKRFVDNIFNQAVNYHLLSGPESPLHLFSEQWVLRLDEQKLLAVAGETRRTRERRERLKKEVRDLEAAMQILF